MENNTLLSRVIVNKNFKHGMLYTLFSFVNNGINFILLLILAKYLSPDGYGRLNLFTTFITLLNVLITLSTNSYVAVNYFRRNRETLKQIILVVLLTATIVLIGISITLTFFPIFIYKAIGIEIKYLWLGILISYFQVFNSLNLDIWRLEEKPISYGVYSLSFAILNFLTTFFFIVGLKQGWEGRIFASWIIGLIYYLISIIFLYKRNYIANILPSKALLKETFAYSIPLLPHSISFWLKQGLDRYIINFYHDQEAVGYYSFAMNLAAVIGMVGTAFNATNSVFIFKKLAEGYEKVRQTLANQTKIMTISFLIITVLVGIAAWGIISFGLPRYSVSIKYITPLCITGFFQCLYLLWVNYLFYYKKTTKLMHITLCTAIIQAVLSIWLTKYDILFTAYISLFTMFITFIIVRNLSKKIINQVEQS